MTARPRSKMALGSIAEAIGIGTWLTVPFWLSAFAVIGTPMDPQYLGNMYHYHLEFTHVEYLGALLLAILIAAAVWISLYRGEVTSAARFAIRTGVSLIVLGMAANAARIHFFPWLDRSYALEHLWLTLIIGVVLATLIWRFRRMLVAMVAPCARIGAAVFVLAVINTGVAVAKLQPTSVFTYAPAMAKAMPADARAPTRVVWMIFDELDERVAFVDRPPDVEMPTLDRFRTESVTVLEAVPPGDLTSHSMPSLLLGSRVVRAESHRQDDVRLYLENDETLSWRENPGIFQEAHDSGYAAAIAAQGGAAYCRLFARILSDCAENNTSWNPERRTLYSAIHVVGREILIHVPMVYRHLRRGVYALHPNPGADHMLHFQNVVDTMLRDPTLDLILIHWNVPHWPFFYDYRTNAFADFGPHEPDFVEGYLGNLELTDRVFGEARAALEAAGLWEDSAIVVSADHRWRVAEKLDGVRSETVPMMVKLPGSSGGTTINQAVDTVGSRRLIIGLLRNEIVDADGVAAALMGP